MFIVIAANMLVLIVYAGLYQVIFRKCLHFVWHCIKSVRSHEFLIVIAYESVIFELGIKKHCCNYNMILLLVPIGFVDIRQNKALWDCLRLIVTIYSIPTSVRFANISQKMLLNKYGVGRIGLEHISACCAIMWIRKDSLWVTAYYQLGNASSCIRCYKMNGKHWPTKHKNPINSCEQLSN